MFFQNLAAFEVIGTRVKSNSGDVFGHGTALLKISGHYVHICGVLNSKFLEELNSNTQFKDFILC